MKKWKRRGMPAVITTFCFAVLCLLAFGQTARAEEQREIEIQYIYVNAAGENSYYEEVQYMPAGSTWGDFFPSYTLAYENGTITDADADNQWEISVGNTIYSSTDSYYSKEIPEKYAYVVFRGRPENYKEGFFRFEYYENEELKNAGNAFYISIPSAYAYGSEEASAYVERNIHIYDYVSELCNKSGAVVTVTPRDEAPGQYADVYIVKISVTVSGEEESGSSSTGEPAGGGGQNTGAGIPTSSGEILESTVPISSLVGNYVAITSSYQSIASAAGLKDGQAVKMSVAGSLGPDAQAVLNNAVMSVGAELAYIVDISLNVEENGVPVGSMHELSSPVTLVVEAPYGIDGNLYDFAIIRIHGDGSVTLLPDLDDDPNTVTFATDRFSIFAVVYNTKGSFTVVKDNVPKTGDALPAAVPVSASVALAAMAVAAFACSKRKKAEA